MEDERLKVQPLTRAVNVSSRNNQKAVFQTFNLLLLEFMYCLSHKGLNPNDAQFI